MFELQVYVRMVFVCHESPCKTESAQRNFGKTSGEIEICAKHPLIFKLSMDSYSILCEVNLFNDLSKARTASQ